MNCTHSAAMCPHSKKTHAVCPPWKKEWAVRPPLKKGGKGGFRLTNPAAGDDKSPLTPLLRRGVHYWWALLLIGAILSARPAFADDSRPPILRQVGVDQRLDAQVPLDLQFRDETGATVRLGQYFGSKPVILTLVYHECPMLCSLVLNGLVSALRAVSFDVGNQFDVVTVSINPNDTPALAASKKSKYLADYRRAGAERGWHFLTGDAPAIEALTRAVGFRYQYDQEHQQYAHAAVIMVLTPAGRVARYFYGVEYAPRDLRLGLIEAADERIGTPVDQVLLYCYEYDPAMGRYSAAIMNLVRAAGLLTLVGLGTFVTVMWRRERRVLPGTSSRSLPKTESGGG